MVVINNKISKRMTKNIWIGRQSVCTGLKLTDHMARVRRTLESVEHVLAKIVFAESGSKDISTKNEIY